jgi:translocation and assembly module TamB
VPLAGGGTFAVSPQGVRDADATVTVGANRIAAKGSYGRPGDSLALELEARNLAQIDRRAAGQLAGQATIGGGEGRPSRPTIAFDVRGTKLRWASERRSARCGAG